MANRQAAIQERESAGAGMRADHVQESLYADLAVTYPVLAAATDSLPA